MKFIHTGDIHWGIYPDANKSWGKEYAQATKNILRIIIEKAKEMDADCLSISGDLFHRQPLMKDLKEVNYLSPTVPAVKVTLIADNHDRIRGNSVLLSFIWSPNVTFITDEVLIPVYPEDVNTEVYGFSYHTAEIRAPLLENIQVPLNNRIQIPMVHGDDTAHLPINFSSLELSPFSYIALGHIHKPHALADGRIVCCGLPEPLNLTETGSYDFYAGEAHPVARKLINFQFTPAASLQYIPLTVNVSRDTINGELCGRISDEIGNQGSQHTHRFRIRSVRDPDTEFDLKQLTIRYRVAEIIDDSEPQYDFSALSVEHSSDMIGFYIQAPQKEDMSLVEKKALYYEVNAPLRTTDERSRTHEDIKSTHRGIR